MGTKLNFNRLMLSEPTELGSMVNSKGQLVKFYEHPTKGDEAPIIVSFDNLGFAFHSDFFDTADMEEIGDYEQVLVGGQLKCGYELE